MSAYYTIYAPGYGPDANWPDAPDVFEQLIQNLQTCKFTAVLADNDIVADRLDYLRQYNINWVVDLTDSIKNSGYKWDTDLANLIANIGSDAWGYHLNSEVTASTRAQALAAIAVNIANMFPDKPIFVGLRPVKNKIDQKIVHDLAKDIKNIGVYVDGSALGNKNASNNINDYFSILSASSRGFFIGPWVYANYDGSLQKIQDLIITPALTKSKFSGLIWWISSGDMSLFRKPALQPQAQTIQRMNYQVLQQTPLSPLYEGWSNDRHDTRTQVGDQFESMYTNEGLIGYILQKPLAAGTVPLYEGWSNERYDTRTQVGDQFESMYTNEGLIGYILQNQVPGTVPLYEGWSNERRDTRTQVGDVFEPMYTVTNKDPIGYIFQP